MRVGPFVDLIDLGLAAAGVNALRRPLGQLLRRRGPACETGDEEFDRRVIVSGPPALAHAVLGAGSRAAALQLFAAAPAATLTFGWIVSGMERQQRAYPVLESMFTLAARLGAVHDVAEALAVNALSDPLPAVRIRNLRMLARDSVGEPVRRETLARAADDPDDEVALAAALEMGAAGRPTLFRLAGSARERPAAAAIRELGAALPAARALALLEGALDLGSISKAVACMEALAGAPTTPVEAETVLVRALAAPASEVVVAAAQALARLGSIAAVPPLEEAARHRGGTLRGAARAAVAAIQSRRHAAAAGEVSLAGDGPGQVTLADDPSGRVSLRERE